MQKLTTKRKVFRFIIKNLMHALIRVEFHGAEHIPSDGGIIVATNHMSRIDIPTLLINPVRPDITALVTDKYQDYAFFRTFVNLADGIWLDRTKADFTAFRQAGAVLKEGTALGIAPEGTRSKITQLLEGKPGTVLLALKAKVPIVPVGIYGTEDSVALLKRGRRPHITANFGPAFTLPPLARENRDEALNKMTEEIMCRIAALLPEKYHGFYAGNPLIKEYQ